MVFPNIQQNQRVTYWSTTPDNYGGFSFGTPVTFAARWEDKNELFIDSNGREQVSASVAWLEQDVAVDGYLYLGESAAADPTTVSGARRIMKFNKTPDLAARYYLRKVMLV